MLQAQNHLFRSRNMNRHELGLPLLLGLGIPWVCHTLCLLSFVVCLSLREQRNHPGGLPPLLFALNSSAVIKRVLWLAAILHKQPRFGLIDFGAKLRGQQVLHRLFVHDDWGVRSPVFRKPRASRLRGHDLRRPVPCANKWISSIDTDRVQRPRVQRCTSVRHKRLFGNLRIGDESCLARPRPIYRSVGLHNDGRCYPIFHETKTFARLERRPLDLQRVVRHHRHIDFSDVVNIIAYWRSWRQQHDLGTS
mmetsp:Transcript_88401/g.202176  ORF Transcript_88401/g.202176 Transcript_88401/m.202176 type:complete len:250 (-) Transcript_88401:831-1580(-)